MKYGFVVCAFLLNESSSLANGVHSLIKIILSHFWEVVTN